MARQIDVNKLKRGDRTEFEQFVNAFKDRVYSTCLSFIPNQHDAQDLSQEVFLEVYASVAHFKENAQLSTWVYRIAVNKCLEEIRRRKQQKRSAFFKGLLGIESEAEQISGDKFDHPGFQAENKEKAEMLFAAIGSLPENQKIAYNLTQVEGYSYDEASKIMGTTIGAIESLLFRAKKNLRKTIKRE